MDKSLVKEIIDFIKQEMSYDDNGKPKKKPLQFFDNEASQEILSEPASPVHDQKWPAKKEKTAIVE